ncbi:hypothetical protein [Mycolicibacterium vulneris]|uniref:hypothetical protein n=1 Tax=Mycolicibacterium vulneris TaxID=547163 RepID=UPI001FEA5D2C|nr:hypothetical protein [Mycolicibacterium vulneris]
MLCIPVTTTFEGITVESSLAWLLQPLGVDTFLDECAAGRATSTGCWPGLRPSTIEHVQPEPSAVQLVKGGEYKDPAAYRRADGGLDPCRCCRAAGAPNPTKEHPGS